MFPIFDRLMISAHLRENEQGISMTLKRTLHLSALTGLAFALAACGGQNTETSSSGNTGAGAMGGQAMGAMGGQAMGAMGGQAMGAMGGQAMGAQAMGGQAMGAAGANTEAQRSITNVAGNVHLFRNNNHNALLIDTNDGLVLVDAIENEGATWIVRV